MNHGEKTMKKILIPVIMVVVLLISLPVMGCGTILVTKDGETDTGSRETRTYDFTDFTWVEIGSAFEYEIRQADNFSISVTAGSNIFDDITVTKSGETLNIHVRFPGISWSIFNRYPALTAVITMPFLEGLESSGATHGTVSGFESDEFMDVTVSGASTVIFEDIAAGDSTLNVSGASSVHGDFVANDFDMDISGASTVQLKGTAEKMDINCSGASTLRLAEMKAVDADIILSSASRATLNLTGSLDVNVSGASTLEYSGDPVLGKTSVTGASTLRKK